MKLLLAEDTQDLSRALVAVLNHEGYDVTAVYDGKEASDKIMKESFDAIILDIMMPLKSGIEVLREIRQKNITTPVLLLTAKAEIDDRVVGLDAGADDYLTKPFAMKELLARIRAMTRRKSKYSSEDLRFSDVVLRAEGFELSADNTVRLSVKEFELMQLLIMQSDRSVDTKYILEHIFEQEDATPSTVWLYISYLKSKLESIGSNVTIIGEKGRDFVLKG